MADGPQTVLASHADDPTEFGVSLLDEYCRVQAAMHLSDETMAAIAATSATASGASAATKRRMLDGIGAWRMHGAGDIGAEQRR